MRTPPNWTLQRLVFLNTLREQFFYELQNKLKEVKRLSKKLEVEKDHSARFVTQAKADLNTSALTIYRDSLSTPLQIQKKTSKRN